MTQNDIIQGCKKSDPKFQRLLVMNYSSMLMTVSRRYAPQPAEADDILQDAFINIFQGIQSFDPNKGQLEAWMRRIVINVALKRFKKSWFKYEVSNPADHDITLHPSIYSELAAEEIMKIIEQLPNGYKQVFNLYAVEGYRHKEIAQMLGIEEVSSRTNLSRAKSTLRKKIQLLKHELPWQKIS